MNVSGILEKVDTETGYVFNIVPPVKIEYA